MWAPLMTCKGDSSETFEVWTTFEVLKNLECFINLSGLDNF